MPKQSRSRTKPAQETQPQLLKAQEISSWLNKLLDVFPQKGTITSTEVADWQKDLLPFSEAAIDFAFEAHRRNGLFFPVPGQIIDLCISYDPPDQSKNTLGCSPECKRLHGTGYGPEDIEWLWARIVGERPFFFSNGNARMSRELVQARALAGKNSQTVVVERKHKLEVLDYEKLLDELDASRGGPPSWRAK